MVYAIRGHNENTPPPLGETFIEMKSCPECLDAIPVDSKTCPLCGAVLPVGWASAVPVKSKKAENKKSFIHPQIYGPDPSAKQNTQPISWLPTSWGTLRQFGVALVVLGIINLVVQMYFVDPTVQLDGPEGQPGLFEMEQPKRVFNTGLQQYQLMRFQLGLAMTVTGALLLGMDAAVRALKAEKKAGGTQSKES